MMTSVRYMFLKFIHGLLLGIFAHYHGGCASSSCEITDNSWSAFENRSYYFSTETNFSNAKASEYCEKCDAHLAIDDKTETHEFIKSSIKGKKGHWIGITVGSYHWTNNYTSTKPNITRVEGDPNVGPCVVFDNGQLRYSACDAEREFICKKGATAQMSCMGLGWTYYDMNCYRHVMYDGNATYAIAAGTCQGMGAYLTTILENEEKFLNERFRNPFWIGMSRLVWPNNQPVTWQQWIDNDIGDHECFVMHASTWRSEDCSANHRFICEKKTSLTGSNASVTDTLQSQLPQSSTSTTKTTTKQTTDPALSTYGETSVRTDTTSTTYTRIDDLTTVEVFAPSSVKGEILDSSTIVIQSRDTTTYNLGHSDSTVKSNIVSGSQTQDTADPVLIGGVIGAAVVLLIILVIIIVLCKRRNRKSKRPNGDYDASYEIAFSPHTEDKTRNSDSSLTDDEKLAQLRNRDSRVVIDSNVPDSEKIKPYLVTTIVDGHGEGQPSRRSKVVSSIEDRVEYDNNNLDDLIVTDNDLYHSSGSDPNPSNGRPRSTDYDYAVRPPNSNQLSQGNVFINNAYDGEAEGGAVNDIQGAQIHYADIAFSTETLNKENTYADIDDFAPHHGETDANVPTTAGVAPSENKPSNANNETDSDNQVGKMKAIPVYAEVDANKMDKNKNEIIDDRKDAHDLEEGINDLIVTDNDLYDFDN